MMGSQITIQQRISFSISLTLKISVSLCCTLSSSKLFAWSELGHSIVGAIAEETINEKTKDFIRGTLGIEPLAVAAAWPDKVRDDGRFSNRNNEMYDFSNYHFCEIPVGYNYDSKPQKVPKDCYGVTTNAIAMLKDTSGAFNREMKIIALRYLAHVIGDIHQPLHVGNGQDRGGNTCNVFWKVQQDKAQNLHSIWDDQMVGALGKSYEKIGNMKGVTYYPQYLEKMKISHPEKFTADAKVQASKTSVKDWLLETQTIRENGVYPKIEGSDGHPYCISMDVQDTTKTTGKGTANATELPKDKIPILTDDSYITKMLPVVETQLINAGLRLAATLDDIAESVASSNNPSPTITKDEEDKIIKTVQEQFKNK